MSLKKLGRYDLIRVLGKGAMGLVYEGRDPNLDRRVAIKTIKVENLSDEAAAEYEMRFRTEARSAARLQHPNIVSVYDSDRDLDVAYLVMEFIQGDDLKHHLDQGKLYTLEQTMGLMADLLSALEYAHKQNIVHRDIKPANLLIEPGGRIKLTDFGVARIQDSGDATRTQGTMVGTLKYMAPEQVQGLPVDARADLFAAGIVLYQLLTGRRPFDGDSDFTIIQQIVHHTPTAPSAINPRLPFAIDTVVSRALAKSRDQRYSNAQEFAAGLQSALREASDLTITPPMAAPVSATSSTWTATLRAGEGLVGLQSNSSVGMNSTVTQELELVYWKDIKDSTDAEDLEGFLLKFPGGIYEDLAKRRLRKLSGVAGEDTDKGGLSPSGTLVMPGSAAQFEKTQLMGAPAGASAAPTDEAQPTLDVLRDDAVQAALLGASSATHVTMPPTPEAPAAAEGASTAEPVAARTVSPASPASPFPSVVPPVAEGARAQRAAAPEPSPAVPRKPPVMVIAAGALLAMAGLAYALWPSGSAPATSSDQGVALATPAQTSASGPASVPVATGAAVAVSPAAPLSAGATVSAQAEATASAPALAASRAAAAKKLADDRKARQALQAQQKSSVTPPPGAAGTSGAAGTGAAQAGEGSRKSDVPVAASSGSPRTACESRMLIAFQMCMSEQCAKPGFSHHPICVERQAMEQRRNDALQNR